MPIEVADENWAIIRDAVRKATSMGGDEDIVETVILERKARKIVDRIEASLSRSGNRR